MPSSMEGSASLLLLSCPYTAKACSRGSAGIPSRRGTSSDTVPFTPFTHWGKEPPEDQGEKEDGRRQEAAIRGLEKIVSTLIPYLRAEYVCCGPLIVEVEGVAQQDVLGQLLRRPQTISQPWYTRAHKQSLSELTRPTRAHRV